MSQCILNWVRRTQSEKPLFTYQISAICVYSYNYSLKYASPQEWNLVNLRFISICMGLVKLTLWFLLSFLNDRSREDSFSSANFRIFLKKFLPKDMFLYLCQRERKVETEINVREIMISCVPYAPHQGSNPQPSYVLFGIQDDTPTNWAGTTSWIYTYVVVSISYLNYLNTDIK